MRKLLLCAALLMFAVSAQAQEPKTDWTEVDVTAYGFNGVTPRVSAVNYINNKGIGLYVGGDEDAGPLLSWRTWRREVPVLSKLASWIGLTQKPIVVGIHVLGETDFTDGTSLNQGRGGLDFRPDFGADNIDMSFKILWEFEEGQKTRTTFGVGLVMEP